MRWMRIVATTAALSMAGLTLPATAQAGSHYGYGYKPYHSKQVFVPKHRRAFVPTHRRAFVPKHRRAFVHKHRRSRGDALAAGIFGLAAGAIIAGALAQPRYYRAPAHGPTYAAPIYGKPAPWTPDWYAYCASKYRSFDPHSGTFQPYNGPRRLCQ